MKYTPPMKLWLDNPSSPRRFCTIGGEDCDRSSRGFHPWPHGRLKTCQTQTITLDYGMILTLVRMVEVLQEIFEDRFLGLEMPASFHYTLLQELDFGTFFECRIRCHVQAERRQPLHNQPIPPGVFIQLYSQLVINTIDLVKE